MYHVRIFRCTAFHYVAFLCILYGLFVVSLQHLFLLIKGLVKAFYSCIDIDLLLHFYSFYLVLCINKILQKIFTKKEHFMKSLGRGAHKILSFCIQAGLNSAGNLYRKKTGLSHDDKPFKVVSGQQLVVSGWL